MTHLIDVIRLPRELPNRQELVDEACDSETSRSLVGASLNGLDLSGLYLGNASIVGVDFRGARCRGVTFPPLKDCNLDSVDASYSHFTRLERCTFRRALLSSSCFGARMSECCFVEASMAYARITANIEQIEAYYGGNDFTGAHLLGLDAPGAHLPDTCFARTLLIRARLSRANLHNCDLRSANLDGASLTRANVQGIQVKGATLRRCLFAREQHGIWLRMQGATIDRPRVAELTYDSFVSVLMQAKNYRIDWKWRDPATWAAIHAVLLRDQRGWRALMLCAIDEAPGMMYVGTDSSPQSLASEIASDYAGWEVEEGSVQIDCEHAGTQEALRIALPMALRQMLATDFF